MIKSTHEIYWLAGLLEGEGSFSIRSGGTFARIAIGMTDYDTIFRVKNLMCDTGKRNNISTYSSNKRKDMYQFCVHGKLAIQWMMTLYPLMSNRRQRRIKEILLFWKAHKIEPRRQKLGDRCSEGHLLTKFNSYNRDTKHIVCRLCHVLRMKSKNGAVHSEIELRLIEHLKRKENELEYN